MEKEHYNNLTTEEKRWLLNEVFDRAVDLGCDLRIDPKDWEWLPTPDQVAHCHWDNLRTPYQLALSEVQYPRLRLLHPNGGEIPPVDEKLLTAISTLNVAPSFKSPEGISSDALLSQLDAGVRASQKTIESTFVCEITVIDPNSKRPVHLEIRKLATGALVGIDGSWLEQDVGPTYSPYDNGVEIIISDDELTHEE